MDKTIKLLIADDVDDTRDLIKTLLSFEDRIEVIGEACNGEEAIELAVKLRPDIVLMDINMPVKDGLKATESISIKAPEVSVIIMSVQKEQEYLKKAMLSGAKEYIIKPFELNTSVHTIIDTYEKELERKKYIKKVSTNGNSRKKCTTVSFFSTKGGCGKSTLAVNTALSVAKQTGEKVVILDTDLQFGDVSAMLDLTPKKTIVDLIDEIAELDSDIIEDYLIDYDYSIKVLCAPIKPEHAEYIDSEMMSKIIEVLKSNYSYLIIDTPTNYEDTTLSALDASDIIYTITTMDLLSIKNVKLGLDVMESLNYSHDKVKIIVNKATQTYGIKFRDIKGVFNKEIDYLIPEDSKSIITSINNGYPFMKHRKGNKLFKSIKMLTDDISSIYN